MVGLNLGESDESNKLCPEKKTKNYTYTETLHIILGGS